MREVGRGQGREEGLRDMRWEEVPGLIWGQLGEEVSLVWMTSPETSRI